MASVKEVAAALPNASIAGDPDAEIPDSVGGALAGSGATPPKEQSLDAVVIAREVDANGNIQTPITLSGDVKVTEVETLLKLALKNVREALGI